MKCKEKKILILSNNVISESLNNGLTINNIFQDWSDSSLSQIYFNSERLEVARNIKCWKMNANGVLKNFFGTFRREELEVNKVGNKYPSITLGFNFFKRYVFRDLFYLCFFRFSSSMKSELSKFSPDSIFLVGGGSFFTFHMAFKLSKKLNIPVSIFLTDNYLFASSENQLIKNFAGKYTNVVYSFYLKKAKNIFVISDELGIKLRDDYSINYELLINPGKKHKLDKQEVLEVNVDKKVFSYFGGLHFNRDKVLCSFAKSIKDISSDVEIRVYTFKPSQVILDCTHVSLMQPVQGREYLTAVLQADFLLHVESFSLEVFDDVKYSISTKIPEYLSFKKPIVAIGPDNISSIKIILNNELGVVLSDPSFSANDFVSKVEMLLSSKPIHFQESIDFSYKYWKKNYSPQAVYAKLTNLL